MRNRASEYDLDNNLDHVKMMLDDWKSGLPKIALVNKYGITEHAYKVFNKECKDRGYTRVGSTKGSLVSMLDKLKVRDRSASPVRDLRQEYYDKYGTDTEDEKKVEPDKKLPLPGKILTVVIALVLRHNATLVPVPLSVLFPLVSKLLYVVVLE